MNDLVEFLRARYAEQEAPLREVVRQLDAHAASDDDVKGIDGGWTLWGSFGRAVDAAFQPRQLLQAVEAKRKLVDLHADGGGHDCPGTWVGYADDPSEPCPTMRLLGSEWTGHDDYQQEWAPWA